VYPNPRVAEFIESNFIPVGFHIKEHPTMWHRFSVSWTPAILVLAPDGEEHFRIEGFLPADEFLGQLHLALGHWAVRRKDWKGAEEEFQAAADHFPQTDAAPEGLYWAGVARYSASHDGAELRKLGQQFKTRYQNSSWAKRASIWE
jgi:hypothetical protein